MAALCITLLLVLSYYGTMQKRLAYSLCKQKTGEQNLETSKCITLTTYKINIDTLILYPRYHTAGHAGRRDGWRLLGNFFSSYIHQPLIITYANVRFHYHAERDVWRHDYHLYCSCAIFDCGMIFIPTAKHELPVWPFVGFRQDQRASRVDN